MALTPNQRRGFLAAWAGWALDGMDSFVYALVMVPALRELLPKSGHDATTANIGYYGSILFALFLIGWGCSFLWGPLADRFGRVRTLMLTILCYSMFTFAGAIATSVWQLAIFRFLAGIGIGGEWTLGSTFISEEWPEHRRTMGAGLMQTGYYGGILLAALLNATVGAHYGWRAMFAIGGLPALLVVLIRFGVKDPARWKPSTSALKPLKMIFSPTYRRRTILNSLYLLVSITGLWANKDHVPATQAASLGTAILSIGTILASVALPLIAERLGRRAALAIFFAIMFCAVSIGFGYLFYLPNNALLLFQVNLLILGIGGGNFAVYAFWLPEQYPTECRASAFAFATSSGRFLGAGITFLVGAGVAHFGSVGIPVALTSVAFLIGLLLLPFGVETKGQPLPE
jgi:MFS family permease